MTTAQTREALNAYADALLSFRDIRPHVTDEVTMTFMGTDRVVTGKDAVRDAIKYFHEIAFSSAIEVKGVMCGEGEAMLEAEFIGTHVGEFEGIAPTLKAVRVPYAVAYAFEGNKVSALRLYFPFDQLMQQIGSAAASAA